MSKKPDTTAARVDMLMESASKSLVARRYFECERLCVEAMSLAHGQHDYERMARILMPLQEARRQKRDQAIDAGKVHVMEDELPLPGKLKAGCYLVRPPRVGLDGRMLREMADRQEVPIMVVVREPTTRTGLWPIVALGPVTIRTRIPAPLPANPTPTKSGAKTKAKAKPAAKTEPDPELPPIDWFITACEALGDEAIATIQGHRSAAARVEELLLCLQAHPDHEKLHQRLAETCMEASRSAADAAARKPVANADLLDEGDEFADLEPDIEDDDAHRPANEG